MKAICPDCHHQMYRLLTYIAPLGSVTKESGEGVGFVKRGAAYMVMDDLVIEPFSS